MLVLSRKVGEQIVVGNNVIITVTRIQGDKVRIGVEAPANIPVHRSEVLARVNDKAEAVTLPLLQPTA
jgi:carbon storage regulator